ncbi:hypothetical protein C1H46_030047 [Malus baccata]|uniref:Uncharacterized protein n=1 Tax=Malus baccata TaxID=106549 RepID=A0A540LDN8_MALBA|nr:hypothetical protein C1H46_030047 [Malus baccata]
MSTSHQLATITLMASSLDSPPILPIASSGHHHTILAVENTIIILQIPRYFPEGIDKYFENVGGKFLDAVLLNVRVHC